MFVNHIYNMSGGVFIMRTSRDVHGCLEPVHSGGYVSGHFKRKDRHNSKHFSRTYLKNNLSVHDSVAKRLKMYCSSCFQRDSSFLLFHAPVSRDFAKLNLLFLCPNLIVEIGSSFLRYTCPYLIFQELY